ncbi:hypothetical protein [Microbulbifer hainanensis]|uniref:hypothetical protein n=1 Tax=Microbulbifer hainanensis TaxID=2735675 RepID=UPI0018677E18|nr:hypothetical protein [Microbulbifer hainanensis]
MSYLLDEFLKAISPPVSMNKTASLDPRMEQKLVFAFAVLISIFIGLACVVVNFGLISNVAELLQALEDNLALDVLAGICLAGLLVSNFILYRHYLLLLTSIKTFRSAILRHLRGLLPRVPALCAAPRTAHGCRAPPFAG